MKGFLRKHSYLLGRIGRYLIILYIIVSINFLIPRVMPGDPVINLLGEDAGQASQEDLDRLREKYGIDAPIGEQYVVYLSSLVQLDLGYSIHKKGAVSDLLVDRMGATMKLVLPAVLIGAAMALVAGSVAGFHSNRPVDRALTSTAVILYSVPTFLLGMVALAVFSAWLGWFPMGQLSSGGKEGLDAFLDSVHHLFLPVMVLAVSGTCSKFLVLRNAIHQIRDEYFIFVADAKGLPDRIIAFRHVLRNVLPQFISMVALSFGFMLSGALLIEIVFSLRGMGTLTYDAVIARDYPVLQGVFLVLTVTVLLANLIAEILYGVADPRIRHSQSVAQR
ncbi:MAG: ABC transporter permease [Methanomassiliicoccales archaeon]